MTGSWAQMVGMPAPDRYRHGSRARYVSGCRCDECKAANVRTYHERQARAKAAADGLPIAPPAPAPQQWTTPSGEVRTRVYRRLCPGINGKPCPHGTHLRKDSSPVCARCRDRLAYRGLVSAAPVRRHLKKLSAQGLGYKSVGEACDVGRTTLAQIVAGARRCRADVARRILAVTPDAIADSALVDAGPTWKLINELLDKGWTKTALATALGSKSKRAALQIRKTKVEAQTALAVRKFHAAGLEPPPRRSRWGIHPPIRTIDPCMCAKPLELRGICVKCERPLLAP